MALCRSATSLAGLSRTRALCPWALSSVRLACARSMHAVSPRAPRRLSDTQGRGHDRQSGSHRYSTLTASASVALALGWTATRVFADENKPAADDFTVDKSSGVRFPNAISPLTAAHFRAPGAPLTLVGCGVRRVTFLGVQVYSIGLYVPPSSEARQRLASFSTEASPTTAAAKLVESNLNLAIRLIPVRNPDIKHLREAFGRAMFARTKQLSPEQAPAALADIEKFKAMFPQGFLAPGDVMDVSFGPGGEITLSLKGAILGSIKSPFIAACILDTYLGDKTVSKEIQQNVLAGLKSFASA